MTTLDLDFVRRQFPAFQDPESSKWAYMENAGGSLVPSQVTDKLIHFYTRTKVQPYGGYGPSAQAGKAMDRSHELLAAAINADTDEVSFGPSTTQNTYVMAQAMADELSPGDTVIVTNQDHEANIGAWRRLENRGMHIKEWQVDPHTGLLNPADLYALLDDQTRLVCFTHCSNIAATINPVKEITQVVHDAGARVVVDAVSYAPHNFADVKDLDVDFYLFSLYKTYGPHLGLIYAKREHMEKISNQGHFFNQSKLGKRLTPAGPNHAEIGCAGGIVDYFDDVYHHHFDQDDADLRQRIEAVFTLFGDQEQQLMTPLMDCLTGKSGVKVIGINSADHRLRAPTIAFYSEKIKSADIAKALFDAKVGGGQDHFYAYRLIDTLGVDMDDGVVRLSLLHYNSVEDVERAVSVLDQIL